MACVRTLVLVLTLTTAAFAQRPVEFEFGVRAGVPLTEHVESNFTGVPGLFTERTSIDQPDITGGPTFGVLLYDRILFEFDALYKPIRFTSDTTGPALNTFFTTNRGSSWEFPLVVNYRFLSGALRPYGGGGMVLGEVVTGTRETRVIDRDTLIETRSAGELSWGGFQSPAYIVNAGLEWTNTRLVLRPGLRYTHWDSTPSEPRRNRSQFEFLIGFSFRGR